MKILHVTQGYFPALGGTEILMQRVSEELAHGFGDEVTVFTTNCYSGEAFFTPRLPRLPVGWEDINGVRVRRFPVRSHQTRFFRFIQRVPYILGLPGNDRLRTLGSGPMIPELAEAIDKTEGDVIAASSFPLQHMYTALGSARRTGRPIVLIGGLHPQDRWGFDRPMIYRAIRECDAYIAYTTFEAEYLTSVRNIPAEKISVVGAGVDPEPFEAISCGEARERLNLPPDVPIVGFIGQIGGHKGVDTLVESMKFVWAERPEVHLLIAGAKTLFLDRLNELMSGWTDADRERIHWFFDFPNSDKPNLYNAVDIFAYPSGYESFGIAFLEAWAAQKPVVSCRRGAIPAVVDAGQNGLLVPYQRPAELAEAILLLLNNPVWAQRMGENGHQKMKTHYTWPAVVAGFRRVYQLAQAAHGAPG